jgi:PAS domain-containing protein
MSDRPRGDPGWAWYEREVARLEAQLAKEREKKERLRDALESVLNWIRWYSEDTDVWKVARAALASTGSEE